MFSEGETIVRRSTVGVSSGWENVVLAESEPGVEELELGNGGRGVVLAELEPGVEELELFFTEDDSSLINY